MNDYFIFNVWMNRVVRCSLRDWSLGNMALISLRQRWMKSKTPDFSFINRVYDYDGVFLIVKNRWA